MKLHLERNAFKLLLEQLHERTGYRTDVLEKDYYVVLMLKELAEKQRQEFLSGLLNDLDNHNFTIEDLATLKGIQTKLNRPKMKARYEYEGIDGQMYLWSGQGKIPKAMAEVMKRDNITDKNHYLIDKE